MEKLNNLHINVFGCEDKCVHPLRLAQDPQAAINLMFLEEQGQQHWVWIKNFSRLCSDQTKNRHHRYFCMRCLSGHNSEANLERHLLYCNDHDVAKIVMPTPGSTLRFINFQKKMKCPYIIYADCESIIKPLESPALHGQHTTRETEHIPCSVGYVVIQSDGVMTNKFFYRGENALEEFLRQLEEEEERIKEDLEQPAAMSLSPEEEQQFQDSLNCWICMQRLDIDPKNPRVRDHDHITGDFRGAAHSNCNLQLRIKPEQQHIPVVFHNLKGYDGHLIISSIGRTRTDTVEYHDKNGHLRTKETGAIHVIANNSEKYVSFSWRNYRFIDSLAFLNASLDKLVRNTPREAFIHLADEFHASQMDLVRRKGVYPCEYMDDSSRFEEDVLPPKEAFYSSLTDEHISNDDYLHAQHVWDAFGCRTLGDYHDLYLKTGKRLMLA